MAFLQKWGVNILLSLITAGTLALCRYMSKQMKEYRILLDKRENEEIDALIEKKLEPVLQELEDLRTYVRKQEEIEGNHLSLIIASYKFRLIQLCKIFLHQGYMTQNEYDTLSEFYKLYEGLGGNGQAKEYYERTIQLDIKDPPPSTENK